MVSPDIAVTSHDLRRLPDDLLAAWRAVEERAADGNAFASASFVLPALRHLKPQVRAELVLVTRADGDRREVIAAAPLERSAPTIAVPIPHWRPVWTEHSYQSGLLVDRDHVDDGCDGIAQWLTGTSRRALHCPLTAAHTDTEHALARALQRRGWRWFETTRYERASLRPDEVDDELLRATWSKNQRKKERRYLRDLGAHGDVGFAIVWPETTSYAVLMAQFLRLEASGWKGETGSAMASGGARSRFAREVCAEFASHGALFFSELRAGADVVACSVNFRSADVGFGFKIGWDARFEDCSPGTLHEHLYVRTAPAELGNLREVDATADPGSFVDRIWPQRRTVASGVWVRGRSARLALRGIRAARRLKRRAA